MGSQKFVGEAAVPKLLLKQRHFGPNLPRTRFLQNRALVRSLFNTFNVRIM